MSDTTPTFKVALLGDGGVGKTSLLKRHITGEFEITYTPTVGVEIRPLTFATNYGQIRFNIWDIAGQDKFGGLREGYLIQAQAAIIMFDVTSKNSYTRVSTLYDMVRSVCGTELPIVICGNKLDLGGRSVFPEDIVFPKEHGLPYYDISVKSNLNFAEPFLRLAKSVINRPDLVFVECLALSFSPADVDPARFAFYQKELEEALNQPLPDDDDL
mmetsp:Transcript_46271/g.70790  ORF Transcript_46271/g.70790 Transcript_46271/m.70790 type:complete len:214 (+) Transcript_46271:42-683(+)|eukprot:CAMPEP_0117041944 /NCGR_PEP_ID=MMETSP0472-20121206/29249_1 /TAXON_ID=693140 ORGANISM="Tiarina fusus, Strain LIS" /NCGR_SAMPLE_ID=MMETSP0472 /ASSEMBLY_ACC=CAM_ASM_000603 /LENGTH=213 /DNA_ID=CAMNT_0004753069 /DNA_START=64 /DNA_END=705 /DNA_ORIENTATION=+